MWQFTTDKVVYSSLLLLQSTTDKSYSLQPTLLQPTTDKVKQYVQCFPFRFFPERNWDTTSLPSLQHFPWTRQQGKIQRLQNLYQILQILENEIMQNLQTMQTDQIYSTDFTSGGV